LTLWSVLYNFINARMESIKKNRLYPNYFLFSQNSEPMEELMRRAGINIENEAIYRNKSLRIPTDGLKKRIPQYCRPKIFRDQRKTFLLAYEQRKRIDDDLGIKHP